MANLKTKKKILSELDAKIAMDYINIKLLKSQYELKQHWFGGTRKIIYNGGHTK